jgi:tetratricopeptide (TPR) repeat protein
LSEINLVHILLQEGYTHSTDNSGNLGLVSPKPFSNSFSSDSLNTSSNQNGNHASTNSNRVNPIYPNTINSSYQMRSESQVPQRHQNNASSNTSSNASSNQNSTYKGTTNSNTNKVANGSISQYISQAELHISKQLWASALKELRSAIQIDCNNSKCHALLGFVYMHQKLAGMAKVSFQQALKLNPEEPLALKYINQVGGVSPDLEKAQLKSKDDKKGGFFGWLGGG